jgi:hypothetical protein
MDDVEKMAHATERLQQLIEQAGPPDGEGDNDGISENFSENTPKKKRGRPPHMSEGARKELQRYNPKTERSRNNQEYMFAAMVFIFEEKGDPGWYYWLMDDSSYAYYAFGEDIFRTCIKPKIRKTVLYELGRIVLCMVLIP